MKATAELQVIPIGNGLLLARMPYAYSIRIFLGS